MTNIVRDKETFVVEWVGGVGSFVPAGEDHFTIDEATAEWMLPNPGWDNASREGITIEEDLPELFNCGYSKLLGTAGNYTWEH